MAERPIHITYDDALRGLRRAVMEKGRDYVFAPLNDNYDNPDNYWYFNPKNGEPGCIVGHVLHYKGVTKEHLGYLNVAAGFNAVIDGDVGVTCDANAQTLLEVAQTAQDQGDPWGTALDSAVDWVGHVTNEVDTPA